MGRIRVLPENVVNRIAAGEVVERPASVVKELVENSIDAGARSLEIRVEEGGRRLVEVLDDGEGMDADDAVAALERHATSKIDASTALETIRTLGFRGEALPSIAAVSRFTLASAREEGAGTRVVVEGGRILSASPAPHPRGTSVSVRDLFFNTPARRRFLRAPVTEIGHIVETATSLALSRPDLRVRLDHGGRRLFDLPGAPDLLTRLAQIEGTDTSRLAVTVEGERGEARVRGFVISGAETGVARGTRRFLVNGRVVRDRILQRAASSAIQECLPAGTAASCVLLLEVPVEKVDVNVHPAKAEVRFAEPGLVHDLVRDALRQALGRARPLRSGPLPAGVEGVATSGDDPRGRIAEAAGAYVARAVTWGGERAESGIPRAPDLQAPRALDEEATSAMLAGPPVILGHYRNGYIIAEDDAGLILIDQHAAHERILFEEMADAAASAAAAIQNLLFPRTVSLPPALRGRTGDLAADLAAMGIEAETFGEDTIVVRGVPAALGDVDPERLVLEAIRGRDAEGGEGSGVEARRRRMLASAACHAAVKVPADLPMEKIGHILLRLLRCRSPLRCPHGRPTMLRWDHRSIERRFGRP